jgi:mannosyltransferase
MSHGSTSTELLADRRAVGPPPNPEPSWAARWGDTLLAAPLLVGLFASLIALVNVTRVSMWVDEGYSISVATRSLPALWRMVANIDVVHGLYNAMLHPWLALTGISELSVRLPSAVATGAAAAGVLVLIRRLAGPSAGLAAGLVFAVLPRVTWMGIEGRSYALTAAVAVWLTLLLVSLLNRPTWPRYVGYAVMAAFACSLNIFLALLLGAHGVALLAHRQVRFTRIFWNWLVAALAGLAGGLPVLLTAVSQSAQIGENPANAFGYLRQVLVNQWFLGTTPTMYLSGSGAILEGLGSQLWKPAGVLLAALGWGLMGYALRRPDDRDPVVHYRSLLLSWLIVPSVVLVSYSIAATPLYNPRYLAYCAPAVAALMGIALVRLGRLPGWRRWLSGLAVAAIILLVLPIYASQRFANAKSGADWEQVAAFVAAHSGPNRAVYFAPRVPPTSDVVTITGRTAQTLYPDAFAGVRDLTLVSTAAAEADLLGRSQPLADSVDRLADIDTVFSINRVDYPSDLVAADEQVLSRLGFRVGERWSGPLNTVVVYTR